MTEQENYFDEPVEEISLRELIDIIKRRKKIIIISLLICLLISSVYTFFIVKPVYESYTTIMVGKPKHNITDPEVPITYQEVQTNRLLVSTYGEIAKSRSVLEEVAKNLKLNYSYEQLKNKVSVNLVKNTEIIEIRVQDTSPELAATIANETAKSFSKQVIRIMNVENVQVIDEAIPIYNKVKPKAALNITLSAVLGLMLGVFAVFMAEFMDNTVKTPEEVMRYLGIPVLASIPLVEKED
ncbi:YveK family protein [Thermovenabulum sp.]|uniref:YveK family protein n=1 Tax=Thermovenabulum sp. TaxID=3100335 RepID=UPI003C7BAAC2